MVVASQHHAPAALPPWKDPVPTVPKKKKLLYLDK